MPGQGGIIESFKMGRMATKRAVRAIYNQLDQQEDIRSRHSAEFEAFRTAFHDSAAAYAQAVGRNRTAASRRDYAIVNEIHARRGAEAYIKKAKDGGMSIEL